MLSVLVNGARWPCSGWRGRGGDGSPGGPRRERELCGLKGTTPDVPLFQFCCLELSSRIRYRPALFFPPDFASLETPRSADSEPPSGSQRPGKAKGTEKRAMKEFLFSKQGNVPRDLVNIKPKGQAWEDKTEKERMRD